MRRYFERQDFQNRRASPQVIIGTCTGLISAAVVACSASVADLFELSDRALRLAFRVGCAVWSMKESLEQEAAQNIPLERADSWSTVIAGVEINTAVDAVSQFGAPANPLTRPYVSAISTTSLTISGSPAATRQLFNDCEALRGIKGPIHLPIHGPYHAVHLYDHEVLEGILSATVTAESLDHHVQRNARVLSPSTGQFFESKTFNGLIPLVLEEILQKPIRYDVVLEATVLAREGKRVEPKANILSCGSSSLASAIASALEATGSSSIVTDLRPEYQDSRKAPRNEKIAIIGMSGRFPGGATDHEGLWKVLSEGLDLHREVPPDRFNVQTHVDESGKGRNKSHTPFGCFIEQPGLFDPRFFNMSPREAAQTDPMARLALVTAYEALEMAGFVPNRTPSSQLDRIGTFYGQTSDDWREVNAAEDIDTYFITGGVRAFAAGRLNYHFGFSGPSFSIDTACSSSLAAIQLACTSLWARDCDMAVTGGMNVLTNPDIFAGLSKGQFLSKTGEFFPWAFLEMWLTVLTRLLSNL